MTIRFDQGWPLSPPKVSWDAPILDFSTATTTTTTGSDEQAGGGVDEAGEPYGSFLMSLHQGWTPLATMGPFIDIITHSMARHEARVASCNVDHVALTGQCGGYAPWLPSVEAAAPSAATSPWVACRIHVEPSPPEASIAHQVISLPGHMLAASSPPEQAGGAMIRGCCHQGHQGERRPPEVALCTLHEVALCTLHPRLSVVAAGFQHQQHQHHHQPQERQ